MKGIYIKKIYINIYKGNLKYLTGNKIQFSMYCDAHILIKIEAYGEYKKKMIGQLNFELAIIFFYTAEKIK